MAKYSQSQLDEAVQKAVEEATAKIQAEQAKPSVSQKDIEDAIAKVREELEAEKKLAVDQARSKKQEEADRYKEQLNEAKKAQMPDAFKSLEPEVVNAALVIANEFKHLNESSLTNVVSQIKNGDIQSIIVRERERSNTETIKPLNDRIAELEAELAGVKADNLRKVRTEPLRNALLAHCNPDAHSQKSGLIAISDMFEDGLDDEGNLIPKQSGDLMGIDPETNKPFTAETAAKHLARTVWYLKKPSTTSNASGKGDKPHDKSEKQSLSEKLEGKSPEEQRAIYAEHMKQSGG